jgi:predicted site-specific integrase-resolvase
MHLHKLSNVSRLFTERQAAQILGVSVKTLQTWRWAGRGPAFVKIGRLVRYDENDLIEVVQTGRRRSTSEC